MTDTINIPRSVIEDTIHALERYAVKRQDFERFESELAMLKAALAAPQPEPTTGIYLTPDEKLEIVELLKQDGHTEDDFEAECPSCTARVKLTAEPQPVKQAQTCKFPDCNCPLDAGPEPDWCARGLPHEGAKP